MRPITNRPVKGEFAGAEGVAFGDGDDEFGGGEFGAFVGAVAEGLGFGSAAGAPGIGAGLEFECDGFGSAALWGGHWGLLWGR